MAYVKAEKRYCRSCGELIVPTRYATKREYEARVYCSIKCINKNGNNVRLTASEKAVHDRNCVQCGGLISLNLPKWANRTAASLPKRFCSTKCYGNYQALERPAMHCKTCDKLLVRKENERMHVFLGRRYCDAKCRGYNRQKDFPVLDFSKIKNEGKFWGSKKDVEKLIQYLEQKGYCLNHKGNERRVKWRDGVNGWGVKWFFDDDMVKVYSYTQSYRVFQTYTGTYAY